VCEAPKERSNGENHACTAWPTGWFSDFPLGGTQWPVYITHYALSDCDHERCVPFFALGNSLDEPWRCGARAKEKVDVHVTAVCEAGGASCASSHQGRFHASESWTRVPTREQEDCFEVSRLELAGDRSCALEDVCDAHLNPCWSFCTSPQPPRFVPDRSPHYRPEFSCACSEARIFVIASVSRNVAQIGSLRLDVVPDLATLAASVSGTTFSIGSLCLVVQSQNNSAPQSSTESNLKGVLHPGHCARSSIGQRPIVIVSEHLRCTACQRSTLTNLSHNAVRARSTTRVQI
jgi:hypothetical protein